MADFNKPVTTDTYANVLSYVRDIIADVAKGLDPANTSPTNVPTNAVRWNSANNRFEKYDGTTWNALSTTFAFQNITASGSVTLSGGTANGVPYLNGSKVLTSGSALTFDGTSFGVGATSRNVGGWGRAITLESASNEAYELVTNGTYMGWFAAGGSSVTIGTRQDNPFIFYQNNTEQMRLTSTGLGIGTSSLLNPYTRLQLTRTGYVQQVFQNTLNSVNAEVAAYDTYVSLGALTNHPVAFQVNNTEQMRLTSTGLGIGTSSPGAKLDVAGNATVQNGVLTVGKDTIYDAFINTPESMYFNVDSDANSSGNKFTWGTDRAGTTGGTTWMTLDSSGNLGLGVTPKAWAGGYLGFQIRDAAFASYTSGFTWVGNNWYSDGSNKYIANGYGTLYEQTGGKHVFYNAGNNVSGAGAAMSLTQAMTLNASGNLGIGETNPSSKLHIKSTTGTAETLITLQTAWSSPSGNKSILWTDSTGDLGRISVSYTAANGSQMSFGSLYSGGYQTSDLMVLNSSGNLGLGVTPSAWYANDKALQVGTTTALYNNNAGSTGLGNNHYANTSGVDTYITSNFASVYFQTSGQHRWYTAPSGTAGNAISFTQAMTLDASGNLIVGATSTASSAKIYVNATSGSSDFSNNATLFLNAGAETTTANLIRFNGSVAKGLVFGRAINADSFVWGFTNTTTPVMTLDASGRLGIGATSVNTALEVYGVLQSATIKSVMNGFDTQATAANVGAGVGLGGKYDASNYAHFALVGGRKENATSGNYAGYMVFETRPNGGELTERARITSGGDFLLNATSIGTQNPGFLVERSGTGTHGFTARNTTYGYSTFMGTSLFGPYIYANSSLLVASASDMNFQSESGSGYFTWKVGSSEYARLNSTGVFFLGGITGTTGNQTGVAMQKDNIIIQHSTAIGAAGYYSTFMYNGNISGQIEGNGGAGVLYSTASDHRLKTNVRPIEGALARMMQLVPREWDWVNTGAHSVGYVAHEAQSVRPEAVTGEKDAVDANGDPIYQMIDNSMLIADVHAALRELTTKLVDSGVITIH